MIKLLGVTSTSAVSEPRTTATAATPFAGFPDIAAFGAYRNNGRRRDCGCVYGYLSRLWVCTFRYVPKKIDDKSVGTVTA